MSISNLNQVKMSELENTSASPEVKDAITAAENENARQIEEMDFEKQSIEAVPTTPKTWLVI
jgi:hypothetical protein